MLPSPEKIPTEPCPSGTWPKFNQWISSRVTQALSKLLPLQQEVRLDAYPLRTESPFSYCPLALSDIRPVAFQS